MVLVLLVRTPGRSASGDTVPDHLPQVDDLVELLLVDGPGLELASFKVRPSFILPCGRSRQPCRSRSLELSVVHQR